MLSPLLERRCIVFRFEFKFFFSLSFSKFLLLLFCLAHQDAKSKKEKVLRGLRSIFLRFFILISRSGHRIMTRLLLVLSDYKFPVKLNDCVALCGGQIE
jgi:hypothetical protein